MKTKTINLYTIEELKKESKDGFKFAHNEYKSNNDYYFMEECMTEYLKELLTENNIKYDGTSNLKVMYSLSWCQGDGAMFTGNVEYKGNNVKITHEGHYYHNNSKNIDIYREEENGEEYNANDDILEEFNNVYVFICKKLERYGYDFIEEEDSEESFMDTSEANEYLYTIEGELTRE